MTTAIAGPAIEVLDGGLLTTIQDAGRRHAASLGVPEGGACDRWSFALANLRCGNVRDAAALELTLVAPRLRFLRPATVSIAGADLALRIHGRAGDRVFPPGAVARMDGGDELGPADGPTRGCRAYLAIHGGFAVPPVLGSASTALGAGFGGFDGRALRTGDVLAGAHDGAADAGFDATSVPPIPEDDGDVPPTTAGSIVGLLPGPHGGDARIVEALVAGPWRVGSTSDRMGIRLDGAPIGRGAPAPVASHGVTWGTIQLPADGGPIVLLADHQPTGGYPVPAVVATADLPRLAQLRPGDPVRFTRVTLDEALAALRRQRGALASVEQAIRDARTWDLAWRSATG